MSDQERGENQEAWGELAARVAAWRTATGILTRQLDGVTAVLVRAARAHKAVDKEATRLCAMLFGLSRAVREIEQGSETLGEVFVRMGLLSLGGDVQVRHVEIKAEAAEEGEGEE